MKLITASSCIRFLQSLDSLDRMGLDRKLDATEGRLLDQIALDCADGRELLVGDLLKLHEVGSQATLHGRIKNLATLGYIKLVEVRGDKRKKLVVPTAKSSKRYEILSSLMIKAVQN